MLKKCIKQLLLLGKGSRIDFIQGHRPGLGLTDINAQGLSNGSLCELHFFLCRQHPANRTAAHMQTPQRLRSKHHAALPLWSGEAAAKAPARWPSPVFALKP